MPPSESYRPVSAFQALGNDFSDEVAPADFPKTILRYRNQRAAKTIGLNTLSDEEWLNYFARFASLPDGMPQPRAIRYHGHQFRHYNPDIGDGRGFLFAQCYAQDGRLLDLSTKGSGRTPYSRSGDGRLTLKGGVREILATAMLEARGVSTSRSFSLIETGEALQRGDEPSPTRSSVLTRLSHSHLRFGVFQRHAFFKDNEALEKLVHHATEYYLPSLSSAKDKDAALLRAACENTARLSAQWMAAGFVHGVLNTDNVTIMGESFDYGPYRFLPHFDPGFTAAYFDHSGLYAFARQPEAVFWNCQALASALSGLGSGDEALIEALHAFEPAYKVELRRAMFARLGILPGNTAEDDLNFVRDILRHLETSRAPWEAFFHTHFGGKARNTKSADLPDELSNRLCSYTPDRPERLGAPILQREAPVDLLYDEIETIWAAIDERDDWLPFENKLAEIDALRNALHGAVGK